MWLGGDDSVVDEVVVEIARWESLVSDNKRGPFKWFSNSSVPRQRGITVAFTRAHHLLSKSCKTVHLEHHPAHPRHSQGGGTCAFVSDVTFNQRRSRSLEMDIQLGSIPDSQPRCKERMAST